MLRFGSGTTFAFSLTLMMPRPRYRKSYIAERRRRWAPVLPYWGMALALLLGVLVAPWVPADAARWHVRWMQKTGALFPWRAYDAGCGYPPLTPYLLTLLETLRLLTGAGTDSPVATLLAKLPGLLAWVASAYALLRVLPAQVGWPRARAATACVLLAAPLFISAALRGQWDALLGLAALGVLLAVTREKLFLASILLGFGAAFEARALLLVPLLLVYGIRKFGLGKLIVPALAGLATILVLAAPIALAGRLDALTRIYLGASPLGRHGFWHLLALGAFVGIVTWTLWKRPTRYLLFLAAALTMLATILLPTRAPERDLLPAVALLAALAPLGVGPRNLFVGLCVTGTLGQLLALLVPGNALFTSALFVADLMLLLYGMWALLRAEEAPVLFENPFDWPDARRAARTVASVTREGG